MFIVGLYHIAFLCLNMRIEAHGAIYDMKYEKHDFESRVMRHEGKRKLVAQVTNAHTRAHE